jgi:hypothetical protein
MINDLSTPLVRKFETIKMSGMPDLVFRSVPPTKYLCSKHSDFVVNDFVRGCGVFGFDFTSLRKLGPVHEMVDLEFDSNKSSAFRAICSAVHFMLYVRQHQDEPYMGMKEVLGDGAYYTDSFFAYYGKPSIFEKTFMLSKATKAKTFFKLEKDCKLYHDEKHLSCGNATAFAQLVILTAYVTTNNGWGTPESDLSVFCRYTRFLDGISQHLQISAKDNLDFCPVCFASSDISSDSNLEICPACDEQILYTTKQRGNRSSYSRVQTFVRVHLFGFQSIVTGKLATQLDLAYHLLPAKPPTVAKQNGYRTPVSEEELLEPAKLGYYDHGADDTNCNVAITLDAHDSGSSVVDLLVDGRLTTSGLIEAVEVVDPVQAAIDNPLLLPRDGPAPFVIGEMPPRFPHVDFCAPDSFLDLVTEKFDIMKDSLCALFDLEDFIPPCFSKLKLSDIKEHAKTVLAVTGMVALPVTMLALAGQVVFIYNSTSETMESLDWEASIGAICKKGAAAIGLLAVVGGGVTASVFEGFKSVLVLKGIISMIMGTNPKWSIEDLDLLNPFDHGTTNIFNLLAANKLSDMVYHTSTIRYFTADRKSAPSKDDAKSDGFFQICPDGNMTPAKYIEAQTSTFADTTKLAVVLGVVGGIIASVAMYHLMKPMVSKRKSVREALEAKNEGRSQCTICGKYGHSSETHRDDIPNRKKTSTEKIAENNSVVKDVPVADRRCTFCNMPGHLFDKCFKRRKEEKALAKSESVRCGCIHTKDCPSAIKGTVKTDSKFPCHVKCGGQHCTHFAECDPESEKESVRSGCIHSQTCPRVLDGTIESNWKFPCHVKCGGQHCMHFAECKPGEYKEHDFLPTISPKMLNKAHPVDVPVKQKPPVKALVEEKPFLQQKKSKPVVCMHCGGPHWGTACKKQAGLSVAEVADTTIGFGCTYCLKKTHKAQYCFKRMRDKRNKDKGEAVVPDEIPRNPCAFCGEMHYSDTCQTPEGKKLSARQKAARKGKFGPSHKGGKNHVDMDDITFARGAKVLRKRAPQILKFHGTIYAFAVNNASIFNQLFKGSREQYCKLVIMHTRKVLHAIDHSMNTDEVRRQYKSAYQMSLARNINDYCLRHKIPRNELFSVLPADFTITAGEISYLTGDDWADEIIVDEVNPAEHVVPVYLDISDCLVPDVPQSLNRNHMPFKKVLSCTVPVLDKGKFVFNMTKVFYQNKIAWVTPEEDYSTFPTCYVNIDGFRTASLCMLESKQIGMFRVFRDLKMPIQGLSPIKIGLSTASPVMTTLVLHFDGKQSIAQGLSTLKAGRWFYSWTTEGGNCGSPLLIATELDNNLCVGIHAYGGHGSEPANSSLAFTEKFLQEFEYYLSGNGIALV